MVVSPAIDCPCRTLATLLLALLCVSVTDAAVSHQHCVDGPCSLALSQPCNYYVERSYMFEGNCCSLSADPNTICRLTVSDGSCTFTDGEPGTDFSCTREGTGERIRCFQHEQEPNVCRDLNNAAVVYDMAEFAFCSALPSHTEVRLASWHTGACPVSAFPLQAGTMWTPPSPPAEAATIEFPEFAATEEENEASGPANSWFRWECLARGNFFWLPMFGGDCF